MRKLHVVRTAMKLKSESSFNWFEVYGVFTTLKRAKEAVETGHKINKGTGITEYKHGDTLQMNYYLTSVDGRDCEYRAIINEHSLNRDWSR